MLDADGGGYSGTNWSGMSMIDMWLSISNQETSKHWNLLSGWRKSYELTLQHMTAVRSYRENLATAWPPEKSPAAAAYVERLDNLISHLQETYDAAVANYDAFSGATLALSSARTDLEKVAGEYFANEGRLAIYEHEIAERSGSKGTSSGKPPVPDGRQAELEAQARSIMYGLSSELSAARTQIRQPTEYIPAEQRSDAERDGGGQQLRGPSVPSIVPFDPGVTSSSLTSPRNARPSVESVAVTPIGSPPSRVQGLVLGGIQPPLVTPQADIPTYPHVVGLQHLPSVIPTLPIPATPNGPSGLPPPPAGGSGRGFVAEGRQPSGAAGVPHNSARMLPPGGIIGGAPNAGLGQPRSNSGSPSRVNPVGGVIGPTSTAGRGGPVAPIGQVPCRGFRLRNEPGFTTQWDPANPWATAEGVPPIVEPPAEQRIDPGPAIGLR